MESDIDVVKSRLIGLNAGINIVCICTVGFLNWRNSYIQQHSGG